MEILTAVQLLAGHSGLNRNLPYSKDILNHFESFSSHEAVLMSNTLLQYGFGRDAPITFMLYLSQPLELRQQIAFTNDLNLLDRSGGVDNLEQYRKSMKQFSEISNFEDFWNSKVPFYNQILDLTFADTGERDLVKILEDYFNETNDSYNILIIPSLAGGVGPKIRDADGKDMVYACIQATDMKDDIPYLNLNGHGMFHLVWHEFGHSFVNSLTERYLNKIEPLSKLFEPISSFMFKQSYHNWEICVNEHIVNAINVRLYELNLGSQQAKSLLDSEINNHFIYIEPLIEKLKDFENQRDKNNITFSEYYPKLLSVFDSLQQVAYWKQFDLNFKGPIFGPILEEKVAIVYPTHDLDTEALKIAQEQASNLFDFITRFKGGIIFLEDTIALKTDLSECGIMAYGTIESNLFLKHHASIFPFRIENQTIYADKEYMDKDMKFITCVPNPLNPLKGMSIHTALSNRAIQGINEAFYESDFPFLSEDFILFLNRETVLNKGFYDKGEKWEF